MALANPHIPEAPNPELQHAADILRFRCVRHSRVIRVYPDAILFLNDSGKPMTAWLRTTANSLRPLLTIDPGFEAWPPEAED